MEPWNVGCFVTISGAWPAANFETGGGPDDMEETFRKGRGCEPNPPNKMGHHKII